MHTTLSLILNITSATHPISLDVDLSAPLFTGIKKAWGRERKSNNNKPEKKGKKENNNNNNKTKTKHKRKKIREIEEEEEEEEEEVTWCFTPSQPLRLYQGDVTSNDGNSNTKQITLNFRFGREVAFKSGSRAAINSFSIYCNFAFFLLT